MSILSGIKLIREIFSTEKTVLVDVGGENYLVKSVSISDI